jgi:hypothetical protein
MTKIREIVARPKPSDNIRPEFDSFVSRAEERGWLQLKVLFGFAWGNRVYKDDWIEEIMTPAELQSRVNELERNGIGSIGDDDLYVTIEGGGTQFTFCHENDIHVEGSLDDPLIQSELDRFQQLGWDICERTKKSEQGGGGNSAALRASP